MERVASIKPLWQAGGSRYTIYIARMEFAVTFPEALMEWVTPQHEEVDLNCEISSYANAEL